MKEPNVVFVPAPARSSKPVALAMMITGLAVAAGSWRMAFPGPRWGDQRWLIGAATGLIMFLVSLYLLQPKPKPQTSIQPDANGRVPCPMCREAIYPDAIICPHCKQGILAPDRRTNAQRKVAVFVTVFVVVLAGYYALARFLV